MFDIKNKKIVYTKLSDINKFSLFKLKCLFFLLKNFDIAIDMKNIKDIKEELFVFFKEISNFKKINILNLNADIMALLSLRNCNSYINIYADKNDFLTNSHVIVNRQFECVKS